MVSGTHTIPISFRDSYGNSMGSLPSGGSIFGGPVQILLIFWAKKMDMIKNSRLSHGFYGIRLV